MIRRRLICLCHAKYERGRDHAGHDIGQARDIPQDARAGCFVIPNPWDVGSALALQHMGFKAIASTSAGFAWSIGKADNHVTLDDVCGTSPRCARRSICPSTPISRAALRTSRRRSPPMSRAQSRPASPDCRSRIPPATRRSRCTIAGIAIERISAARAAIDADNSGVLLVGRCEGFLVGQADLGHGDRPAAGLCGSWRRLSVRARHPHQGADISGREGGASEAGQSSARMARPVGRGSCRARRSPHQRRRARWHAPPGAVLCARRARSRRRELLPSSAMALPAAN